MADVFGDIISATIGDFCRISGIGRSRIYELLDDGTLESVKIGKRRLVLIDSYRKLIARQRVAPSSAAKTVTIPAAAG